MAQQSNLSDALALEKNRFMKFLNDATTEAQTEVAALERELARRGFSHSGFRLAGEMKIRLGKIDSVAEKRIALRRDLGSKLPELLEDQPLKSLKSELDGYVDSAFVDSAVKTSIHYLSSRAPNSGGELHEALCRGWEHKAAAIKARLNGELQALRLESQLGLYQEAASMTSFNISNSTIANLNLGTVVGDLHASIRNLTGQGHAELAAAIQRLTEAITASHDAQRKEFLEHLSFVSTEVTRSPESRRMGPLKSSIAFLQTGLSTASQLATIWQAAEQALKALGVFPF